MKRSYSLVLIAAAILSGCNKADRVTSPETTGFTPIPRAATQTLRGTVIQNPTQEILPQLALKLDDGSEVGLVGQGAAALASVLGAQVEVSGSAPTDFVIAEAAIDVDRFVVLSVGGTDVSDGTLTYVADGVYALNLTSGGTRQIIDPAGALAEYVGDRLWLALADDGSPMKFGIIQS